MFPLQPGTDNEVLYQISSNSNQEEFSISQDTIMGPPGSVDKRSTTTKNVGRSGGRRRLTMIENDHGMGQDDDDSKKKIIHRDIERQRRLEMSGLHASLRSLLPSDFIKGKRSVSDHLNEAVNYIKHLQRKIKEMGATRDELKKASNNLTVLTTLDESSSASSSTLFIVRPRLGGIEIVFESGPSEEGLPLSRVLQVLLEEGISVVNCLSTKVNDRLLHTIQAEVLISRKILLVADQCGLNLPELQQKLNPFTARG